MATGEMGFFGGRFVWLGHEPRIQDVLRKGSLPKKLLYRGPITRSNKNGQAFSRMIICWNFCLLLTEKKSKSGHATGK